MLLKHQPYPNLMYWYSPSPTSNLSNPVQFFHYGRASPLSIQLQMLVPPQPENKVHSHRFGPPKNEVKCQGVIVYVNSLYNRKSDF